MIATGYRRVYSDELEYRIIRWFREHPEEEAYRIDDFQDDFESLAHEFTGRLLT